MQGYARVTASTTVDYAGGGRETVDGASRPTSLMSFYIHGFDEARPAGVSIGIHYILRG